MPSPVEIAADAYETIAASQTAQIMGANGATGDVLEGLLLVPASVSPGAVTITDGGGSAVTVFAGGTNSLPGLAPFFVPIGAKSTGGPWKVTTGASISAIAVGRFT